MSSHSTQPLDLRGQRFGKLTVLELAGRDQSGIRLWECLCDCGNRTVVARCNLRSGATKSCGCFGRIFHVKHGKYNSPEYRAWQDMIQRCESPKARRYPHYGGRGITICERWRHSFAAFFADMGQRPSPKHSLDRIDNNGNYEPGNCRWATNKEQCNNFTRNRWLEHDGLRLTLSQWAERTGLNKAVIRKRLDRLGWSVHEALTIPGGPSGPKKRQRIKSR